MNRHFRFYRHVFRKVCPRIYAGRIRSEMKHVLFRQSIHVPVLAGMVCLASCRKKETVQLPPPIVVVETLAPRSVPLSTEIIGRLDSPENVEVRARVEGFVDKVHFTEGTDVEAGAALFSLDRKPYEEKLAAAEGSLAEAHASLNRYKQDVERLSPLAARQAIPRQDLDHAQAAVESAEALVVSAKAKVESAKIDLGYCDVAAPIAGRIGARQVSMGTLVGKGEPTLLATISRLDPIWFYCNVSEVEYLHAEAKARLTGREISSLPVSLILPDGSAHGEKGKFVFIDRAVDPKTGTLRVRAEFANPAKILKPGMFGRIKVDLGEKSDCIVVPERALVELQGKSFVWVVNADGTGSQKMVVTGERAADGIIVSEGLGAGEKIIVEGLQKVREGAPVKALTAAEMAALKAKAAKETPAH